MTKGVALFCADNSPNRLLPFVGGEPFGKRESCQICFAAIQAKSAEIRACVPEAFEEK